MKNFRDQMVKTSMEYMQAQAAKHKMNADIILSNQVSVGEHSDQMETLEKELGLMSDYIDKYEDLLNYFNEIIKLASTRPNFRLWQLIIGLYGENERSTLRKYLSDYRELVNSSIESLNKIKKNLEEEKIEFEDKKGNLNQEKFIQVVKNKVLTTNPPSKGIKNLGNKVIHLNREKKLEKLDDQKDELALKVSEDEDLENSLRSFIDNLTGDQYEEPGGSLKFDNLSSPQPSSSPSPQLHSPPVPDILNNSIFFSTSKPEDDVMDDISFNDYLNNIINLVIDFGENINSDEEDSQSDFTVCPEKKTQHSGLYYTLIRQVTPNPYNINILNQNISNKIVSQTGGSNNTYTSKNKNHLKKLFKRNLNRVTRKKISNHVKPFFF